MDMLQTIGIMVGVVAGVAGLVLGIMNQIHQRDTTRPRLRVRPRVMRIIDRNPEVENDMNEENVGVMEICNVGNVPVIGNMIGFLPKRKNEKGLFVLAPQALNGSQWPGEIQPGHMILLRMNLEGIIKPVENGEVIKAYVASIVGDVFKSSKRDMRDFKRALVILRSRVEGS